MTSTSRFSRGMTLIELMVAMIIGLGVTLAVTSVLISGENHKRTTTSTNDAEQTGAYTFYALDRVLRGAGSGFAESAYPTDHGVLGCKLNVSLGGAAILPRGGAFPDPFSGADLTAAVAANLRVAPLLIGPGMSSSGSDVLIVMEGSGSAGGVSRQVTGSGSGTQVVLDNVVGFFSHDLALVSQSGTPDCLLEEVSGNPVPPALNLGATYFTAGSATTLATLAASTSTYVTPLGNTDANNVQFEMFGVGANRTLYSYDLLQATAGDVPQPIAEGVQEMHAIYGVDTDGDGKFNAWASPTLDANYDLTTVMTTPAQMRKIISVRVALVMRGEYYDKNPVSPSTLTIFRGLTNAGGTSLQQIVTLSDTDKHYRYRVFEFTVPLRNMLLLAGA